MTRSWKKAAVVLTTLLLLVASIPIVLFLAFIIFWNGAVIDDDLRDRTQTRRFGITKERERIRAPEGAPRSLLDQAAPATSPPIQNDPVQRLLTGLGRDKTVVVELSALRHSVIGEHIVACVSPSISTALDVPEAAGVDMFEMFDRLALLELDDGKDVVLITGHFGLAAAVLPSENEVYRFPESDDGTTWVLWRKEALLLIEDEAQLAHAIAALEAEDTPRPRDAPEPFGEIVFTAPADKMLDDLIDVGDVEDEERERILAELSNRSARTEISLMSDLHVELNVPAPSTGPVRSLDLSFDDHLGGSSKMPAHVHIERDASGLHYRASVTEKDMLRVGDHLCKDLRRKISRSFGDSPVTRFILGGVKQPAP